METCATSGLAIGDSLSAVDSTFLNRYGLVSHYASRYASTAGVRALEREIALATGPIKFGRLAKPAGAPIQPAQRPRSTMAKPVVPARFLNVVAGHAVQPEPA